MFLARKIWLCGVWLAVAAAAQEGGDLQAQILYAYQVEDLNGLTNLSQELRTRALKDEGGAALRYHLAHANYRLGLLRGSRHLQAAPAAFSECIDALKPAVREDVKSAESLTLQSACYFQLANDRTLERPLLRSRAAERLRAAMALAPRNPRAVFLSAIDGLAKSKPDSAQHSQALKQLEFAVQLFDASPATNSEIVGWGHAEAYLALAREQRALGDRVGARNLIEKSLIAAPDYKEAQRQLVLSR